MTSTADRLRGAGLRATRPRAAVLEWLDGHPGHHSADAVVQGVGLPRATAYHVLGQLAAAELVLTAEVGPGVVRYETATRPHHHFICSGCDAVIDVPCAVDAQPCLELPLPEGSRLERADVLLRGRCPACAG